MNTGFTKTVLLTPIIVTCMRMTYNVLARIINECKWAHIRVRFRNPCACMHVWRRNADRFHITPSSECKHAIAGGYNTAVLFWMYSVCNASMILLHSIWFLSSSSSFSYSVHVYVKPVKRFQMKSNGCRDVQHTGLQSTQTRRTTGKQGAQTRGSSAHLPKHPYISGCMIIVVC